MFISGIDEYVLASSVIYGGKMIIVEGLKSTRRKPRKRKAKSQIKIGKGKKNKLAVNNGEDDELRLDGNGDCCIEEGINDIDDGCNTIPDTSDKENVCRYITCLFLLILFSIDVFDLNEFDFFHSVI